MQCKFLIRYLALAPPAEPLARQGPIRHCGNVQHVAVLCRARLFQSRSDAVSPPRFAASASGVCCWGIGLCHTEEGAVLGCVCVGVGVGGCGCVASSLPIKFSRSCLTRSLFGVQKALQSAHELALRNDTPAHLVPLRAVCAKRRVLLLCCCLWQGEVTQVGLGSRDLRPVDY